ncbi:MAG TPA: cytochrome b N-terminal domain-containing protein [Acidimicrobiales bacterium]|nr:cytochrome b N-terminal domain-containing protein [Acidimicrobiales bacterium]
MTTTASEADVAVSPDDRPTWTGRFRARAVGSFPPERLLPDRQPAYVASWIYVFGALTLAAFAVVLLSGAVLAIEGPAWYHSSSVGLYFNSMHLWGTELFFFFMVVHLWGKFFMAAWRGRRRATWITGVLAFVISIANAFTGYLSQQNFDSEWIGTQAKDGINSTGAGAFWNVLNFGQMLLWHVLLLPLVVAVVVGIHVLLVRRRGVVPPFSRPEPALASTRALPAGDIGFADDTTTTEISSPDGSAAAVGTAAGGGGPTVTGPSPTGNPEDGEGR